MKAPKLAAVDSQNSEPLPSVTEATGAAQPAAPAQAPQVTQETPQSQNSDTVAPRIDVVEPDPQPAKRGRGRPPGSGKRKWIRPEDAPLDTRAIAAPDNDTRYHAMADQTVALVTGGLAMGLGPEWNPRDEEEKKFLVNATYEYYKAKKFADLPPGLVLLAAVCVYALPRINDPHFIQRITELKTRWANRK